MKTITPREAEQGITSGTLVCIDVRTREEFESGHIPGARNIDFYGARFEDKIRTLDPRAHYVVTCQMGGRSAQATNLMEEFGFLHAQNLEGGFDAWRALGFPSEVASSEEKAR